jgi:hypothetical protein
MGYHHNAILAARDAHAYADREDLNEILLQDLREAAAAADAAGDVTLAAALRSAVAEASPQRRGEMAIIATIESLFLRLHQGL